MVSKLKLNEQKRQHRERAQPAHRKKLGHLEKHQDYVKRARDFHSKEDRIQKLREKASFRNKDEFYFGMIKSKTKKGIHVQSRGNEPLPTDLVKALKTQDATYIRMQATMEQGRVRKLKEELAALVDNALPSAEGPGANASQGNEDDDDMFMDDWDMYDDGPVASTSAGPKRNHVVFTDSIEAVRQADVSSILQKRTTPTALPAAFTTDATADSASKRRKGKGKAALADAEAARAEYEAVSAQIALEAAAHRAKLEQTLAAREGRLAQLLRAARELELQRHMMGKGKKEQVVKAKGDKGTQDDDWWMQGVKGAKKSAAEENEGKLPMADEGVATGARVWKFKTQRKR